MKSVCKLLLCASILIATLLSCGAPAEAAGCLRLPDPHLTDYTLMGAIALIALVSFLLLLLFGIDYKFARTVEFNPPEGMTPTDMGYIADGSVDGRDVVSLLLYWADKGYLTIGEAGDDVSTYKLTKLKEIGEDAKDYERHMFDRLFEGGAEVATDELENRFCGTVREVASMAGASCDSDDRRLFTKASARIGPWLGVLTVFPAAMALCLALYRSLPATVLDVSMSVLIGAGILLPIFVLLRVMRGWKLYSFRARRAALLVWLVLWAGSAAGFYLITAGKVYEPLVWSAMLGTSIIGLCALFVGKRTRQSAEWYAKILSFRDTVALAGRDRLAELVKKDPAYFYHILPYAYVLDIPERWAANFESIAMEAPAWYMGKRGEGFSSTMFTAGLSRAMNAIMGAMTSVSSSHGGAGGNGISTITCE